MLSKTTIFFKLQAGVFLVSSTPPPRPHRARAPPPPHPNLTVYNHSNIMSIAGIVHDITGCLAQERKYSRVIYTTSSPIFGVDTLGHVNIWNECTSRLIGYSTEKVMGQSLVQDVIPNNFKGAVKVWNQCVIGCVGVNCGIGRSRHYSLPDLVGWLRFLHVGCQDNQDSVVMSLHCGCSRLWPETKAMSPFTSHVGFLVLGYAKHHVFCILQWACLVSRIWTYPGASLDTPVCTVWRNGCMEHITSKPILQHLRLACSSYGSACLGFKPHKVGTHLLLSGNQEQQWKCISEKSPSTPSC